MTTNEPPVSKTESRRSLWVAIVLFLIIGVVIAVILIAPSGSRDKSGADNGNKPAAADPTANGAMTGRTAPAVP
jgi:flagellar basal body-associated protein FliL